MEAPELGILPQHTLPCVSLLVQFITSDMSTSSSCIHFQCPVSTHFFVSKFQVYMHLLKGSSIILEATWLPHTGTLGLLGAYKSFLENTCWGYLFSSDTFSHLNILLTSDFFICFCFLRASLVVTCK